jgi:hypothetical protein
MPLYQGYFFVPYIPGNSVLKEPLELALKIKAGNSSKLNSSLPKDYKRE